MHFNKDMQGEDLAPPQPDDIALLPVSDSCSHQVTMTGQLSAAKGAVVQITLTVAVIH